MERLWNWDRPVSVREVMEDLNKDRSLAYTTVMSVLNNLHRKGMVLREKTGRAYIYRPRRSRASHTAEHMEMVLANNPDRSGALLRFVEQLSDRDIEALRQVVEAADPRRRKL